MSNVIPFNPEAVLHPSLVEERKVNQEAQLAAEVAVRLIEWSEIASQSAVSRWLAVLGALHRNDPAAMWLYLSWQTGDTARIAASFEERGEKSALPRQAVQQSTARAFEAIKLVRPELAKAMREAFEAHAPEARAAGASARGETQR